MSYSVAKRYAQALFDLSQEINTSESVYDDLRKIQDLINKSDEFINFLHNPVIPVESRKSILDRIFKNKVNNLTGAFVFFLNQKNRLGLLKDICQIFEQLHLDLKGVLRVKITSNSILNDAQVKEISNHLKARFKKDIEPSLYDDSSLLGGVKIQEGDTIYDYSLSTQVEQFRENLIKAQ